MIGDMEQSTGENSEAYQAKRDINVHKGMDYINVKQLCLDLIHENFPKLQEEAMKKVNENVLSFYAELKVEIEKKNKKINEEKITEPDVQSALNDAVQGAAKKGKKADLNLLATLVTSRLDKENSDLLDISIEESIKIVPKITKEHINFLSVHQFVQSMSLNIPNIPLQQIEAFGTPVNLAFSRGSDISIGHMQYLASLGVLEFNTVFTRDPYDLIYKRYPHLSSNLGEFKKLIQASAPNLNNLCQIYEKNNYCYATLNSFGQVIALTNLGRFYQGMDLKIWVK